MKKDGKDIEGGRCMRGKDVRLCWSEKGRRRIWNNYVEKIKNRENDWDHVTDVSIIEGPIKKVSRE